jgi:hypothetical protein
MAKTMRILWVRVGRFIQKPVTIQQSPQAVSGKVIQMLEAALEKMGRASAAISDSGSSTNGEDDEDLVEEALVVNEAVLVHASL